MENVAKVYQMDLDNFGIKVKATAEPIKRFPKKVSTIYSIKIWAGSMTSAAKSHVLKLHLPGYPLYFSDLTTSDLFSNLTRMVKERTFGSNNSVIEVETETYLDRLHKKVHRNFKQK